ncbi:HD-GYP domain-containing protein [Streptomyces sp. MUM 178J]|uniref:HD-GYP domain-containing protein n=1 Tax=Streptomyces sp. MUM 178J TaxID=2791991 RepID=UPI001F04FF83|nr:metal-dependent phosphohydrolase [Streptomyces sp. MUM 178J]WRQ81372.1 metal-dependent phosphohydrolase [Streptomyces sp. MUM 178J]
MPRLTTAGVYGTSGAVALAGVGWTAWHGLQQPGIALAFGALIAAGELARCRALPGEREPAPLGAAGALAYALLARCADGPAAHGVPQTVAVVVAAVLLGSVPHVARGEGPALEHVVHRTLTAAFAAVCFQPLSHSGELDRLLGHGAWHALFLLALLALTALCDALLAAALLRDRTRYPYAPLLRDELRALGGVGAAVCATAAALPLAVAVAGLWALPLFCLPLLLTQLSFRRHTRVRTAYRQIIASLARSTEVAGYTRPGHARRVARLSCAVGREMGLSGSDLAVLEYAALMHDIGQLSLVDPVPEGATALLPAAEQRRIALLGGAVVRQTGVHGAASVAAVVERQADPYRDQPRAARIVRAVNAYDDLAGGSEGTAGGALAALEELRLATARDFQPEVVEALARVLARGGLAPAPSG